MEGRWPVLPCMHHSKDVEGVGVDLVDDDVVSIGRNDEFEGARHRASMAEPRMAFELLGLADDRMENISGGYHVVFGNMLENPIEIAERDPTPDEPHKSANDFPSGIGNGLPLVRAFTQVRMSSGST